MANDSNSLKINIKEEFAKLISQNKELKNDNLELQNELDRHKEDLKIAYLDILEWKSKYDSLKTAKTMAASEEEIAAAQARLTYLVRKINKCIALVNQQQ